MTHDEIKQRLLILAKDRLRSNPGAFRRFNLAINLTINDQNALLSRAYNLPREYVELSYFPGMEAKAGWEGIDRYLLEIIDEWAESCPAPCAEPQPARPSMTLQEHPPAEVEDAPQAAPAEVEAVKRSITKQQVINAFEGLHFNRDKWGKYLADPPDWLVECRVTPGVQGRKESATWNPVLIAAALFDKGVIIKKLNAVFVHLNNWADEWREKSASFRD